LDLGVYKSIIKMPTKFREKTVYEFAYIMFTDKSFGTNDIFCGMCKSKKEKYHVNTHIGASKIISLYDLQKYSFFPKLCVRTYND
jgi:hypothetical protein